jgi:hypothetical protein
MDKLLGILILCVPLYVEISGFLVIQFIFLYGVISWKGKKLEVSNFQPAVFQSNHYFPLRESENQRGFNENYVVSCS